MLRKLVVALREFVAKRSWLVKELERKSDSFITQRINFITEVPFHWHLKIQRSMVFWRVHSPVTTQSVSLADSAAVNRQSHDSA